MGELTPCRPSEGVMPVWAGWLITSMTTLNLPSQNWSPLLGRTAVNTWSWLISQMYTCWTRVLLNIDGICCSGDGNACDSIDYHLMWVNFMELHVWLIYLHMDDLFTRSLSFLSCVIQQVATPQSLNCMCKPIMSLLLITLSNCQTIVGIT